MIEIYPFLSEEIEIGASNLKEIIQNVRIIVGTKKGDVVLDRDFGVDGIVDLPQIAAKMRFEAEIVDAIEKYEPRVRVTYIKWKEINTDGEMQPVIGLEVIDELA